MKEVYKSEKYLKINNFGNRRTITKLRTNNHTLAIEAGRWTNIERENRLCKQCTENKIEDEIHFLFQCTKYTAERQKTFETIKTKTNIDLSNNETKIENLKLLFASGSLSSLNLENLSKALSQKENFKREIWIPLRPKSNIHLIIYNITLYIDTLLIIVLIIFFVYFIR